MPNLEQPLASATRQVTVTYRTGLDMRPSGAIVKTVSHFQSKVQILYGNHEADASEILDILSLGVPKGAEVTLQAVGPDAEAVLDSLSILIDSLSILFADDCGLR
jgi:phosphotransferase system HPr (HPr) family protein